MENIMENNKKKEITARKDTILARLAEINQ